MRPFAALVFALLVTLAHAQQEPAQPGLFETLGKLLKPADPLPGAVTDTAANNAAEKPAAATAPTRAVGIPSGERRVALVIGNNAYRNVGKLDNAVPDARAMAREFRGLGFEVIEKTDVDQRTMKAAVRDFVQKIANGGVGAFFYAGHGVQDGGNNFLLPVDVGALTDSAALPDEAVELNGEVMARIGQAGAKFSLLVVDACRNNPFPKKAGRSIGGTRGLTAAANAPEGMIVVYSAGVGQEALDRLDDKDRDPNGLFTREFIREIKKPGLEVAEVVRNVRKRVKDQAAQVKHEQTPAIYIQADRFYLIPNAGNVTLQAPADPEAEAWRAAEGANTTGGYQTYLDTYPKGRYATAAKIKLDALKSPAAVADPPAPVVPAVAQDAETQFWNEVKTSGAREYLDAYLKQYPKGKYAALARVDLKKLDEREKQEAQRAEQQTWEQAKADNGAAAYAGYLERYPKGRYAALAQAGQQKAQREAAEREKLEALRTQREQAEAAQREEAEHWRRAEAAKDSATVQSYLDRYPAGRYVAEARTRLAAVKKEEAEMRPGKVFKDCAECPEMVILPAGSFQMGSDDNSAEKPIHTVTLAKPFAMGKTEVTRGQFAAFVKDSGYSPGDECFTFENAKGEKRSGRNWRNPGYPQQDDHPVACINWDDAKAYVAWLSRKTGQAYRLPSEAEWEYAARAGTSTARYWGDSPDRACTFANVMDATGKAQVPGVKWDAHNCSDGHAYTAPVGSFQPNAFGLYDMIGNVWEWTEDCFHGNYNGAPSDGSAWTSGCSEDRRVLRGGSWGDEPQGARAAFRIRGGTSNRNGNIGFRPARMLPER